MAGLVIGLFLAGQACAQDGPTGPSFDCAKAITRVERVVCADEELSRRDSQMARAFQQARDSHTGQDRLDILDNQRDWLRDRARPCPPSPEDPDPALCLQWKYAARIDQLSRLTAGKPGALDRLLWSPGVACDGNRALIRLPEEGDYVSEAARPPPRIGGRLARVSAAPERCRLADGREVRFKTGEARDGAAYGMCGAQSRELYSVWIGGAKVISREVRAEKCDEDPVRAIYYDGRQLTRCGRTGLEDKTHITPPVCQDISGRLRHPVRDPLPLNSFRATFTAPGQAAFCRSMIRSVPKAELWAPDPNWPALTAEPRHPLASYEAENLAGVEQLDLNNTGRIQNVVVVTGASGAFDGDFWVIPPKGVTMAAAQKQVELLSEARDLNALRKQGFQIFAGDQTPYTELRYVRFMPFRQEGQTWLYAHWSFNRLDLPTSIITRPMPDGTQKLICSYKMTPAF